MRRAPTLVWLVTLVGAGCAKQTQSAGTSNPGEAPQGQAASSQLDDVGQIQNRDADAVQVQAAPEEATAAAEADASLGAAGLPSDAGDSGQPVDATLAIPATAALAVIGPTSLPASGFQAIYALKVDKYTRRGRGVPDTAARRYRTSIMQRLVYREILDQEAARLGITHDTDALARRNQAQRRGIRDWQKHLSRRGETEASLDSVYIAELLEQALLEKEGALKVTAAEVKADYLKIKGNWYSDKPRARASHILIRMHDRSEAEALALAKQAYAEAKKPGADFADVARRLSWGPSASRGGDIGIFTRDRMAEAFSDEVFKRKVGFVSKPVKTKFGYHVIKITGRWKAGHLPKSALKDQITDRMRQRKLHQGRRALKERLTAASGAKTWLDFVTGELLSGDGYDPFAPAPTS